MTTFTHILMCLIGLLFVFSAFFATGIRGAFSRGPSHPISRSGRVIFFLAGLAVFVDGFNALFSGPVWPNVWWRIALPYLAIGIVTLVLNSRAVRDRVGRTVTSKPTIAIRFANSLPGTLVGLRVAFFVIVALILALGLSPMAPSTAKVGIISCLLALFAIGLMYTALENHCVNSGRATVVKLSDENLRR